MGYLSSADGIFLKVPEPNYVRVNPLIFHSGFNPFIYQRKMGQKWVICSVYMLTSHVVFFNPVTIVY